MGKGLGGRVSGEGREGNWGREGAGGRGRVRGRVGRGRDGAEG